MNTAQHTVRDIWMNPANFTSSNRTNDNISLIVNGLPNVQGLGGVFVNNYVDTNVSDWKLLSSYSWVYYNKTSN
jgi:hypothetical protein